MAAADVDNDAAVDVKIVSDTRYVNLVRSL